jgi:HPt (histidine-containing phosphotransfer) domain-containing protein
MTQSEYEESLQQRLTELQNETDVEFVCELIDIYMAEVPKMVQAIHDAISKKDFVALKSTAHALKGSSLNLGAKRIGELCLELEMAGRAGELLPPMTKIDELQKEIETLSNSFTEFKKNQAQK